MAEPAFRTFGTPHLVAVALTLAVSFGLALAARVANRRTLTMPIARSLAGVLLLNETAYWCWRICEVGLAEFLARHLPLHVCGVAVFATAAALVLRSQRAFEIAYFWGLASASNAVLTPGELQAGFPQYQFLQYFVSHAGIVAGALYCALALKMRPTLAGLVRAFAVLNCFAAGVAGLNAVGGSNYMYLCRPPSGTVSPFFFAPWPWYIPVLEVVALGLFFALYSPYLLTGLLRSRARDARSRRSP